MDNSIVPKSAGHTEECVTGRFITSSFAMEPGEPYGDPSDSYSIEAKTASLFEGSIVFSSFEELEEFSQHLAEYVKRHKK